MGSNSSQKKRVELRYSALPRWFLPLVTTVCLMSGGSWIALKTGGMPDLSAIQQSMRHLDGNTTTAQIPAGVQAPRTNHRAPSLPNLLPGSNPLDRTLYLLMGVFIVSGLLTLVGRDTKLAFNPEGLTFPSSMMGELKLRRKRSWTDLSALTLATDPRALSKNLQVYFQSGGRATIDLNALSENDLENLLLCLDEWATQCAMSPELVALRHKMFNDKKTHTSLWEEEMASHFAATNFVALTPGSLLQNSRFKVVMHAFSGGLSAVYLAEQQVRSSENARKGNPQSGVVVIKESVIPATTDEATREKAREMFKREAQLLMQLSHERIAKVLDHFVENGRDYLVLEYIPGLTLRQYIRRNGPQSEAVVAGWTEQIAGILDYLHTRETPIIHRDLTPDNLILTPDGKLYLIDFGAANQFVGAATGTIVGKQLYISPEQFRGKAVPASDIYSLGATMHFLLTGEEPEALCPAEPQSINSKITDGINDLVLDCTRQDTEERVQTAAELLDRLKSIKGSTDTHVIRMKTENKEDGVRVQLRQLEEQLQ
jgi:predicted Ser/Thr protein kinase